MSARTELLRQLVLFAYQYSPDKPFLLASGKQSNEYLDCRLALSQPAAMAAVGPVFLAELAPSALAIGGLTMGSDPIAMGTCVASAAGPRPVRWFSVRKEPKQHGQKRLIEGSVKPGEPVAVVDDVVTSGMSTIKAIQACREYGLQVAQVIVLVDREESGGMAEIRKVAGPGVAVSAIFRKSEIQAEWQRQHA